MWPVGNDPAVKSITIMSIQPLFGPAEGPSCANPFEQAQQRQLMTDLYSPDNADKGPRDRDDRRDFFTPIASKMCSPSR